MPVKKDSVVFKKGDYVMLQVEHPDDNNDLHIGDIGIVVDTRDASKPGVNWFKPIGHGCGGTLSGADRHNGWYVHASDMIAYNMFDDTISTDDLPDIEDLL